MDRASHTLTHHTPYTHTHHTPYAHTHHTPYTHTHDTYSIHTKHTHLLYTHIPYKHTQHIYTHTQYTQTHTLRISAGDEMIHGQYNIFQEMESTFPNFRKTINTEVLHEPQAQEIWK